MNIANLLSDVQQNELVDFLSELSKNNESVASMLVARFATIDGNKELSAIKTEINEIIRGNGDRYGFIDYRASYRFSKEFLSYMENIFPALISAKKNRLAFEALCYIVFKLGEPLNIDDSNGTIGELMCRVMDFWEEDISKMNDDERKKARLWFEKNMYNEEIMDYLQEYLFTAYSDFFNDEESCKAKIEFIDAFLSNTDDEDVKDIFSSRFNMERYAAERIRCMEKLKCSKEEIFTFMEKYIYLDNICYIAVKKYLDAKEYCKAEKLLQNLIESNKQLPGIVHEAHERLFELYKTTGNEKRQKETLRWLFLNTRRFDINLYNQYKSMFSEEDWKVELEKIVSEKNVFEFSDNIFVEEKMYDRLFESVKKYHQKWQSVYNLEEYSEYLKDDYAPQLVQMFTECLKKDVLTVSSRVQYAELADHVRQLAKISGGKQAAIAIRDEWLLTYKNRPAMKDELGRIKL